MITYENLTTLSTLQIITRDKSEQDGQLLNLKIIAAIKRTIQVEVVKLINRSLDYEDSVVNAQQPGGLEALKVPTKGTG